MHSPEDNGFSPDRNPEQKNVCQRVPDVMLAEEDPRPKQIQNQLHKKQQQSLAAQRRWRQLPDLPDRDSHERVKHGPYRPKDPVWRSNPRSLKAQIPVSEFS